MPNRLEQLEARLQALIEGSAARLFSFGSQKDDLGARLVRAMQANLHRQEDGSLWAPNLYLLAVHPAYTYLFDENRALLNGLAELIQQAGEEDGLRFPSPPRLLVQADSQVEPRQIQIGAQFLMESTSDTTSLADPAPAPISTEGPEAFLIVQGMGNFTLRRSVTNLGRALDNDLILEDPRISRSHAQVRLIKGRYVIFDLESTGGTFVNGQRVTQSALYPGDVISLAGVALIFGQDPSAAGGETLPFRTPDLPSDNG